MPNKTQASSTRLKRDPKDDFDQSEGEEAARRSVRNWLARKRSIEEAAKALRDGAATTSRPRKDSKAGAKTAIPCIVPPSRVHIDIPEIDW